MNTPTPSINTRHTQEKKSSNVFVEPDVERPATVEVVCSSARRCMDHTASHTSYRLFSHTLTLDAQPLPTWPERTDICCWHCCHTFETVPISVPRTLSQSDKSTYYEVYGVFCSVNCAKKFVLERGTYDQQQVLLQLNEMCCAVFGIPGDSVFSAKEAPPRYFLKMFGGSMSIEEFRVTSLTTRTTLVMPPFVSHAMVLESRAPPPTEVAFTPSIEVESLREGQHMLRGLRRPTHPLPAPTKGEEKGMSRFDEFLKEKDVTGGGEPRCRAPKKPRRKEMAPPVSTTASNTLNSFLMARPMEME